MKNILLILTILTFKSLYGQTGLTSYPADLAARDGLKIDLIDIPESEYVFYFRLLLSGQTIEIFSKDNKTFQGTIINSIKQYDQVKVDGYYRTKPTRLYTDKVTIDSSTASSIAYQILESGQPSIPTDTLIDTWKRWYLHCESLNFEIKIGGKFIKQSFHCPGGQPDSVKFKEVILSNYDLLRKELKLDSIYQQFWSRLPKGKTYSHSGYGMTYIMTDEQQKAWNNDKPRRDYLKSIKDTIDQYLNFKLDSLEVTFDKTEFSCYGSYHLIFGTKGRLVKILTDSEGKMNLLDGLTWYIEDYIERRKCKRQIRKIFKKVNLRSFNLEHKVYRTFYFNLGDGWMVVDNTIY